MFINYLLMFVLVDILGGFTIVLAMGEYGEFVQCV
jgi:hypothetical protein